jgi:ubiquinone/menaquinone biosynthesis C-methylase UbiE
MARFNFFKKNIKKGKILDVGNLGGDGRMHKMIRQAFSDCEIFGIDKNKQKAEELKFPNQIIGDINETFPFESNFFDTIYLGELIEHIWDPKRILKEVYRVLKKEGVVILDTPHIYALKRTMKFFLTGKDFLGDSDHKIFFTPAVLKNLLEKCGFEIIEITTDRKLNIKNKNIVLPNIPPFKWLGSHLCIAAKK